MLLAWLTGVARSSQPIAPVFEDAGGSAGLTVSHLSSAEKRYIIESMSGGAGALDYDADGDLDLVTVNGSSVERFKAGGDPLVTLYRQDALLKFTNVSAEAGLLRKGWGMGVAAGDIENDGDLDLYVTGFSGNALFRNRGNGTFEDVTASAGVGAGGFSTGAAFADYDRDGLLDLFVARYVSVDIDKLPEFGRDQFCRYRGIYVQCGPAGLPGETDLLFRNRGDGTFEDVSARAGVSDVPKFYGMGAVWGDVDNDGWPDLYVANDTNPNYLYRNRHDGTFEDVSLVSGAAMSGDGRPQGSMGVDFGDYDRDGNLDLFVTNYSDEHNALYRNLGEGGFTDASWTARVGPPSLPHVGWGTGFFDYDCDGAADLLVVNGHVYPQIDVAKIGTAYRQPMLLHRGNGEGAFSDVSAGSGLDELPLLSRRGAAFGDMDDDGDVDVFVVNIDDPPTLLVNRTRDGHRVLVALQGRKSNRSAIGARVTIRTGTTVQTNEVRGGSSYLSQNDLRLHFGLGTATRIDTLEVRWPSGAVERLKDVTADQVITIVEGAGLADRRPFRNLER
jgi:hypothetical protein